MNILVVEDEPKTARHLDRGLRDAGFEVHACRSAEQGLIACAKHAFDALVLDVMLPGMSGLEMVHQLRSSGVATPVLFLSAKDATEDRIKGLNEGGDDYLVKPYSLPEVVARLRPCCVAVANPETQSGSRSRTWYGNPRAAASAAWGSA